MTLQKEAEAEVRECTWEEGRGEEGMKGGLRRVEDEGEEGTGGCIGRSSEGFRFFSLFVLFYFFFFVVDM